MTKNTKAVPDDVLAMAMSAFTPVLIAAYKKGTPATKGIARALQAALAAVIPHLQRQTVAKASDTTPAGQRTPAEVIEEQLGWTPGDPSDVEAVRIVAALRNAGYVIRPLEPTPAMLDAGQHTASEWLNDRAPLGEANYRDPADAVYRAMMLAVYDV